MLPLALTIVAGIAVLLPASLPYEARMTLFIFALAAILWSTTKINAAYVALAALTLAVLTGRGGRWNLRSLGAAGCVPPIRKPGPDRPH